MHMLLDKIKIYSIDPVLGMFQVKSIGSNYYWGNFAQMTYYLKANFYMPMIENEKYFFQKIHPNENAFICHLKYYYPRLNATIVPSNFLLISSGPS